MQTHSFICTVTRTYMDVLVDSLAHPLTNAADVLTRTEAQERAYIHSGLYTHLHK